MLRKKPKYFYKLKNSPFNLKTFQVPKNKIVKNEVIINISSACMGHSNNMVIAKYNIIHTKTIRFRINGQCITRNRIEPVSSCEFNLFVKETCLKSVQKKRRLKEKNVVKIYMHTLILPAKINKSDETTHKTKRKLTCIIQKFLFFSTGIRGVWHIFLFFFRFIFVLYHLFFFVMLLSISISGKRKFYIYMKISFFFHLFLIFKNDSLE